MTRKHFKLIAAALKEQKPTHDPKDAAIVAALQIKQWGRDVRAIAKALAVTNPRFNASTFLDACGYLNDDGEQEKVA